MSESFDQDDQDSAPTWIVWQARHLHSGVTSQGEAWRHHPWTARRFSHCHEYRDNACR